MNLEIAKKRMDEVIKTDVITSSDADFLATHVPLKKIKVIDDGWNGIKSKKYTYMSEEDIFNKYVENDSNKHQFIVVKGSNGVGKSHLIRWLATNLKKINSENEEMLFIKRSDNNLKRTIEQLLEIDAVSNIQDKDVIERLVKASNTINDSKFKNKVYGEFIVEVQSDEKTDMIKKITRKDLEALLQNDFFKERLLSLGGPIDRICAKVSNKLALDNNEIIALFFENDFKVDINFCDDLRGQGADRKAIRMAEKLADQPELVKIITEYLNGFVDEVIQSCAGIKPGDFEKIFLDIRKELKRNNKNLTLFIEDITSFTGVNEALLNVLATEHTGIYEEKNICRITSFVGTTIPYYESFQKNFVDRITNQIEIEDNPFGENDNELFEFVAKYLNAMSLEKDMIQSWVINGCNEKEYPIHYEKEGKEWEHVEIVKGKCVSIYPFTFNAIKYFYGALDRKTPRYLLKNVIEYVMNDIFSNKKNFPEMFLKGMPNLDVEFTGMLRAFIEEKYDNEEEKEKIYVRLGKFIRVWGNATLEEVEINGEKTIGCLKKEMFEEFNLPIINGKHVNSKSSNMNMNLEFNFNNSINEVSEKKETISKDKKIYQEYCEDVDLWMQGETFEKFKEVRDNIKNFLYDAIDWQNEGVSYDSVIRLKNSQYKYLIAFERQKLNQDNALITLKADSNTVIVVKAFLAWQYLGKKKWNFKGAEYSLYMIERWYNSLKDMLIKKVKEYAKDNYCFEVSCIAEIYRLILFGQYKGTTLTSKYITADTLLSSKLVRNMSENEHSVEWNRLMKNINDNELKDEKSLKSHRVVVKYFFNLYQGSIDNNYNNKVFINYVEFDKRLKELLKKDLDMDYSYIDSEEIFASTKELAQNTKGIVDAIKIKVIPAEKDNARDILDILKRYFEKNDISENDISDICDSAERFYKEYAKNQFNIYSQNDMIKKIKREKTSIVNAITNLNKAIDCENINETLILFSRDPIKKVKKLIEMLKSIEKDVTHISNEIDKKKEKIIINSNIFYNETKQERIEKNIEHMEKISNKWEGKNVN